MPSIGHHLTVRLGADRPLLLCTAERRAAARVTLRAGQEFTLLFFIYVDTHGHLLVMEDDPARASECVRRVHIALHRRLGLGPFDHARVRPIEDVWHLTNALRYCLRQREHHGVASDPLLEASNLPDLLGMRDIGAYTCDTLQAWLPRFSIGELVAALPSAPSDGPVEVLDHLAEAAAAAVALPSLHSKSPAALAAKRAAIEVGSSLGSAQQAKLLGVNPRTIRRLRTLPVREELVRAIRLQLSLRAGAQPT